MEHQDSPVSGLSSTQLVTFLTNVGITRSGLDSVWEKEVTGAMLCEFCEEDIKDVFTEFKDRFRIRKLLRDIADKARHKTTAASSPCAPEPCQQQGELLRSAVNTSPAHQVSPKVEAASSALLRLASSDIHRVKSASRKQSSNADDYPPSDPGYSPHTSPFERPEDCRVKEERDSFAVKRQRVEDVLCGKKIPEAHTGSYTSRQSASHQGPGQHASMDAFISPPSVSLFLNKPDFLSCFMSAHPILTAGYSHSQESRKASRSASGSEEQALCLKKSPQRIVSPPRTRSEAASPATQPSSTTPDYLHGLDPSHMDLNSVLSMGSLASKYTAQDILSKKGQRSRPNSAQKLGSILIRTAAQQASLWSSPPHLRNISQPQKQQFLNTIYQVAPHVREYEHLLWQRLSETLQNRRKYLLDKKLGKRGVPSSSSLSSSSSSSSSLGDLPDISEWQVTSIQSHLSSLKEDGQDDDNILNEDDVSEGVLDARHIKTEPAS